MLSVKEIEHSLCEYSKFHRIRNMMNNSGFSAQRLYKSMSSLDTGKVCKGCKVCISEAVGTHCDTCNAFCCSKCLLLSERKIGLLHWLCVDCEAFDIGMEL